MARTDRPGMTKTLLVEIEGAEIGDLELALQEVLRHIRAGALAGRDSNDTGGFFFNIEEID